MSAHTPGPWEWVKGNEVRRGLSMKFLKGADNQGFAHTVGLGEPLDTANARLIAAAPDLLAALKAVCAADDRKSLVALVDVLPAARAAITKAEGPCR